MLVGWRVARSHAGFFPVRAAFPVIGAGRRPHHYFRGLLKLHTRYGLQSCSPIVEMDLPAQFPIIPHESTGVECDGCIITETFISSPMKSKVARKFAPLP